jgi:hypothetical protein
MKVCEYPLERERSPLYPCYSTLGQYPATIVPILYFLTTTHSQDRFDISIGIAISRYCRWTESLAMMLQKCMIILVLLLWLKSRPRDLISWHQKFFHQVTLICRTNAHIGSPSVTTCLLWESLSSTLRPHHMVEIVMPWWDNIPFMMHFTLSSISDQEPSTLPWRLALSCDCGALSLNPTKLSLVW